MSSNKPLVCACLAWYDETPETLELLVTSLAGVADVLVALDGRWDGMPGDTARSSADEARAIRSAGKGAGVKVHVSAAGAPFASQVAKRAKLMAAGARTGAEWLLVIDGDESVTCPDPEAFRSALDELDGDVAQVTMHIAGRMARQIDRGVRRLYRAATGVTVEVAHNGYRTSDGRWLHGDSLAVTLEPAATELEPLLTVNHHIDARSRNRSKAAASYRIDRRARRLERWAA